MLHMELTLKIFQGLIYWFVQFESIVRAEYIVFLWVSLSVAVCNSESVCERKSIAYNKIIHQFFDV
jgi:hypothetical protein